MLLGFIGTLVWDRIWHPAAKGPVEQWGGAVYSLAALAAARPQGWTVRPLIKVGRDLAEEARAHLERLPGLELDPGTRLVDEPNNRVELRYHDHAHRTERLTGGVPPWSWPELAPLVSPLDALYLNFLSGTELDLAALEALRAAFPGPMYADLHSLFLGPPCDGPRPPRALPDAARWLRCFDAVQLNESELALLLGRDGGDAGELLPFGPTLALVTRGGRGVSWAARAGLPPDPLHWRATAAGAGVEAGSLTPEGGEVAGDPTGCGDVWGAVVWSSLLGGRPLREALSLGNRGAAAKIRRPRTADLHHAVREALAP